MTVRAPRRPSARREIVAGVATWLSFFGPTVHPPDALAEDGPAEGGSGSLRVVTFNAFIAPGISPDIEERLEKLGPAIAALEPDLVGLQEVWNEAHAQRVASALAEAGLDHQHWVARPGNPPLGSSGLLTASRYPIENAEFFPFTAGDAPAYAFHADWMAGKGVLLTRVKTSLGDVDFANTHLHGNYSLHDYEGVRLAQMSEIAKFLGGWERRGTEAPPLVLAGDLNSNPESLPFRLLAERADLRPVSADLDIDHILVPTRGRVALRPVEVRTVLTEPVELSDGQRVALSDHPGVLAVLVLGEGAADVSPAGPTSASVTREAVELASQEIRASQWKRWPALIIAMVGAALGVQLGRRAYRHRRRRALWVLASLVVAIGVSWLAYLSLVYWPGHVDDLEAATRRLEQR